MKCPKCGMDMTKRRIEGMEIDNCPKCGGIWCDLGEYDPLLGAKSLEGLKKGSPDKYHDSLKMTCPQCKPGSMVKLDTGVKGVHIDKCTTCCGVWLDGGELEKMREAGQGLKGILASIFG